MRNRFALWLQSIGNWLIERGERLYVYPLPQNTALSAIISATLRNRSAKIASEVIKNNALLKKLADG